MCRFCLIIEYILVLHFPQDDAEQDATVNADSGFAKKFSDIKSTLSKRNFFKRPALSVNSTVPTAPPKDFNNADYEEEAPNDRARSLQPVESKVNGQRGDGVPAVDGYQQVGLCSQCVCGSPLPLPPCMASQSTRHIPQQTFR